MPTLAAPQSEASQKYDEGDFIVTEDVPVFKEHQTREMRGDDGEVILESVWIGEDELRAIADRCNERIEDTGDYAVIVLRHTDDEGVRDPKVVGFMGPFKVGYIGKKEPVAAILARQRIFKEDAAEVRRYPRRSVEFWADRDNPACGYFDPISLLGAEAPELDLGIQYSKGDSNTRLVRYSKEINFSANPSRYEATAPGGSNTFVPSGTGLKDKSKQHYSKESSDMALSPEDVMQITAALKDTIKEIVAQSIVEALAGPEDTTEGSPGMEADSGLPTPDAEVPVPAAEPEVPKPTEDIPERYSTEESDSDDDAKPATVAKYRKRATDLQIKYQKEVTARRKAEDERDQYKSRIDAAESEAVKAVRYQKLSELQASGYVLDPDEEIVEASAMSEEQFQKHTDRIVQRYQRVPTGMMVGIKPSPFTNGTASTEKSQKYAKQASENVLAARNKGVKIDYATELNRLVEADSVAK